MRSPEALQQEYHQQNHPELQPGEMWITNSPVDAGGIERIGYKSKRTGVNAYDVHGNEVKGLRPVFISKEEYERRRKEQS